MQVGPRRLRRIGMAAAVLAVAATPLLPGSYMERMTTILAEDDYNMTSPTGRKQVWLRGLGYAAQYPVFGVGVANFNWAEGTISSLARNREPGQGIKFSTAHNSYVLVLAELGIVAGAVFACWLPYQLSTFDVALYDRMGLYALVTIGLGDFWGGMLSASLPGAVSTPASRRF